MVRCRRKQLCGRGDQTDRFFSLGRDSLARDVNLVRIVRSLRVLDHFLEDRMHGDDLNALKVKARKQILKPLPGDVDLPSPRESEVKSDKPPSEVPNQADFEG